MSRDAATTPIPAANKWRCDTKAGSVKVAGLASTWGTYTRRVKPSPPYLATVVIAVLLMVIGLSLEGSLFSIAPLNQVLGDALAVVGVRAGQEFGRILIIAAPTLLILGSLVRGI
jgi:hypothetical protein